MTWIREHRVYSISARYRSGAIRTVLLGWNKVFANIPDHRNSSAFSPRGHYRGRNLFAYARWSARRRYIAQGYLISGFNKVSAPPWTFPQCAICGRGRGVDLVCDPQCELNVKKSLWWCKYSPPINVKPRRVLVCAVQSVTWSRYSYISSSMTSKYVGEHGALKTKAGTNKRRLSAIR